MLSLFPEKQWGICIFDTDLKARQMRHQQHLRGTSKDFFIVAQYRKVKYKSCRPLNTELQTYFPTWKLVQMFTH